MKNVAFGTNLRITNRLLLRFINMTLVGTVIFIAALFCSALVSTSAYATEIEIKPSISSLYTYIGDAPFSGVQLDTPIEEGHQAITIEPAIEMIAKGPVWQGNWSFEHTSIKQLQSEFDDTSFNNISLNNQFGFVKNRVILTANATRTNQNVDRRFAGVSDPIFGQSEYIDVDNASLGLILKNKSGSDWRNQIGFTVSKTDFDEEDLQQTDSTSTALLKGESKNANISIAYGQRMNQLKATLSVQASSTDRDRRGEQKNGSAYLNVGIPVWSSLDLVLTGTATTNRLASVNFDEQNLDNESYGAGLAWRFSNRSYVEVTYNKDTQGQTRFSEEDFDDTFLGYRLVLEPSKHTALSYEKSRRFYGDANSLSLSHQASRWNVNLSYSEDLATTSRLQTEVESAGLFSCYFNNIVREECTPVDSLPTNLFIPELVYLEFFDRNYFFQEELSLTKGLTASLSYQSKKSTLSLSYNRSSRQFLERENDDLGNEQESRSVSINFNYRMSRRTSFVANVNKSEVVNLSTSEANASSEAPSREGFQASIGLTRKLTRKATGQLNIRQFDNKGRSNSQNRKDTRLELKYTYLF